MKISLLEKERSSPAAPVTERQRAAEASPQGCTLSFLMMDGGVNTPASGGTSFYFQGCEGRMTFCGAMARSCGAGRGACEISEELIGNDVPCDFSQVPCNFPQVPCNFPQVPCNFPQVPYNFPQVPNNFSQVPYHFWDKGRRGICFGFWGEAMGLFRLLGRWGASRKGFLQLKLVNGVEHDVTVEGFGATELAGARTYVAAFRRLLAEQVNGF